MLSLNKSGIPKISQTPTQTGCYLLKDHNQNIIYVGKAKNLRQRIKQHLKVNQNETFSIKQNRFLNFIHDWEIILTNNIKEALILEQNLIKKHQPRFNVLLKDDHTYPYIKITNEPNPRYLLVKKITSWDKNCFGPFPDGTKARETLQILERIFPLTKCKGNLGKPCLEYLIGKCSGHCFKEVKTEYYQKVKQEVIKFFQGKIQFVKKELQKSLKKSIAQQEFELAKREKKILDNLSFFTSEQSVEFPDYQNYDFLGYYSKGDYLACCLLLYRYGKLTATENQIFKIQKGLNEKKELLQSYLYQFYQKNLLPETLYLPYQIDNQEILAQELGLDFQVPQRGKKRKILELAQQNAQQVWQKSLIGGFQESDKVQLLEELGNFLQIPTPYFIEILDISNLFQQDVIAGFLTYVNGKKDQSKSKIYQISSFEEQRLDSFDKNCFLKSDVAWIKKACWLHYQKKKYFDKICWPQLFIVDGGKPQVKAVLNVWQELNLNIPVIGLVKNESHQTEKIISKNSQNKKLESLKFPNQQIKNFLTNLQIEVHYYALNFHRKLHRKTVLS